MATETHDVFNQPEPLENYNAYTSDRVLHHWLLVFGGSWGEEALTQYGHRVGHDLLDAGFQANKYKPEFHSHDRFGHRIDMVEYHPAYHQLMQAAIEAGHHALPWVNSKPGAHVVRAAVEYLHTQADAGSGCPLTMTFASVPALRQQPDIAGDWIPRITTNTYDPRNIPFYQKNGVTIGMAMTEKQGGSDVRANTTLARPLGVPGPGQEYLITGHKWFCSAPMCDAFLMLAYSDSGLSCFLLPRWKPDGSKNSFYIQRLKNKVGNVSNASSEMEYRDAFAWMIGPEGRGINTILEMVAMTRFDCMVGSSAQMRLAVAQALHHTAGRAAFGKPLHQQPLMQNVLADLALEAEAALAISLRIAHALDHADDECERALVRIGTAVGKYWICKRTVQHSYEAMESIGAVAMIEDNVLARLYRDAPVNAIWEGSGNIQCLDVVRVIKKDPACFEGLLQQLEPAAQAANELRLLIDRVIKPLASSPDNLEYQARTLVESLALAWQAAMLIEHGDGRVADLFVRSRLALNPGSMYGTLPPGSDCAYVIERAQPSISAD
ncbi:acyl-CoA dehydrogenase family protein [Gynuella sp.]|uniref:acyl-CoA dehydrogenase family protein n=1 Tax=Gynuella sp. TaxID=2969146 RepID=UPI003D1457F6